ncbi:GntP family permease [Spongiimicrobium sp. 3-5]|uniref:GntP family permease n=1 Tax=Spongiimicrobium sp. 3-5 TaxID=3332596 RepID=UPI003980D3DA
MEIFLILFFVILFIIIATVKFKVHPVFSLVIAALITGGLLGKESGIIVGAITEGFGKTLSAIGLIIAFGTVIGAFLERTGGTKVIADSVLKWIGLKRSPLAMNITGFVISIPVFCDSGFIILSSLNKALSKKTGLPVLLFAVSLATGLYTAHVFIPPTPGPLAAAAVLEADLGLVFLFGMLVAIPVSLVGYLWARFAGKSIAHHIEEDDFDELPGKETPPPKTPGYKVTTISAFLPLVIPITFIALKSIVNYPTHPFGEGTIYSILNFVGDPTISLLIGALLAFNIGRKASLDERSKWVITALKDAGSIILITGAGGAFGNVLRQADIAGLINLDAQMVQGGILVAFGIAAILKTAQGSSTVSIITTAAIMAPLLVSLGLDSAMGKTLTVLAIGAGAMTVSHINDSYFWVVTQFSKMNVKTALRSFTTATFLQGITALIIILIIQAISG